MSRQDLQRQAIADAVIPALKAGVADLPGQATLSEWLRDLDLNPRPRPLLDIRMCQLCSSYFPPISSADCVCARCRDGYGRKEAA